MNQIFGMKVKLNSSQSGEQVLRNVTEIHWRFPSVISAPRVAFESDIHSTGVIENCAAIVEFEAVPETEIAPEFSQVS